MSLNHRRQGPQKRSADEAFKSATGPSPAYLKAQRSNLGPNKSTGKTVDFPERQGLEERESHPGHGVHRHETTKATNLKAHARSLLSARQQLPIFNHADQIRRSLRERDVLLLVGETGSGKSTQLPQFLVSEPWCKKRKVLGIVTVGGCIAITQPRRVAAISLARRVAEEMGTPLGKSSPASQVGYSVRFENSTSPSTKIKFLTEGMLLQEMLRDPWLKEYSAVVVDEVHERGVNVDLVLGFLRRMQDLRARDDRRGGIAMKVVVMSATADMEKIKDFFNQCRRGSGGSLQYDNTTGQHEEHDAEWSGFSDDERNGTTATSDAQASEGTTNGRVLSNGVPQTPSVTNPPAATSLFIKGRQFPVTVNYTSSAVPDVLDAASERIKHIHTHCPLPGDILVFLTGQESVDSLLSLLAAWSASMQRDSKQSQELPKLLLLPLYAALPSNMQQRVFQTTPKFTRKIILATNIAETSITVPGIRYVVDGGKVKQRLFRPSLNLDTLLTVSISRSSANQRSGRAGRDAPGTAYRLYTETDFYQLSQDTGPEILRCDLSQLVLTLKAHSIDNLSEFPLLTSPPRRALERAMIHLIQLSALDTAKGQITSLGRQMSALPLPASLARVLLASAAAEFDCVQEVVDIVSALSVENIFLTIRTGTNHGPTAKPLDPLATTSRSHDADADALGVDGESRESLAQAARQSLFRREGDHLTLLATIQAYAAENTDRRRWCDERYVSHRALSGAMDVRKQLTALMARHQKQSNSNRPGERGNRKSTSGPDHDRATLATRVLKCMLTGFHPNVARLCADGSYRTLLTNQAVAIHPSSVLFSVPGRMASTEDKRDDGSGPRQKKYEGIMYNEFVYTGTKAYARGVSAIEMKWLSEVMPR